MRASGVASILHGVGYGRKLSCQTFQGNFVKRIIKTDTVTINNTIEIPSGSSGAPPNIIFIRSFKVFIFLLLFGCEPGLAQCLVKSEFTPRVSGGRFFILMHEKAGKVTEAAAECFLIRPFLCHGCRTNKKASDISTTG